MFSKLRVIPTLLNHSKLHCMRQLLERAWFFASDVMYFAYSQVTDAITIHQVFDSGQFQYAYLLLGILLIPFVFMFLLVVRVSVAASREWICGKSCIHRCVAILIGLLMSPAIFFLLELALVIHGMSLPLPSWFKFLHANMSTIYRVQSLAETFLNAVPQAIVQTKLYLGNDPNGIHVYIDTQLYLVSMTGSLSSLLKSVAMLMIEFQQHTLTFGAYCMKLVRLEDFGAYKKFVRSVPGLSTST